MGFWDVYLDGTRKVIISGNNFLELSDAFRSQTGNGFDRFLNMYVDPELPALYTLSYIRRVLEHSEERYETVAQYMAVRTSA